MNNVEILMSSYNGERYIREQVESLLKQTIPVHITVRDDGSKDGTIGILSSYDGITVIEGKNQGATESFLSLIECAPEAEYYALCDQDDVWDPDKVEVAIETIQQYSDKPALYSGNTRLVDQELNFIKNETLNPETSLGSAIVKNYATGCTIVFNRKLMLEINQHRPEGIPFHDWWLNLVCLSVGGVSIYDTNPHMSYRQHGNNVVSGNDNAIKKWKARFKRYRTPYHRNIMAKQILDFYGNKVSDHNIDILKSVMSCKWNSSLRTGNKIDDFLFRWCILTKRI